MNKIKFLIIILTFCAGINLYSQEAHITNKIFTESNGENNINVVYPQIDFGPDALMGMRGVAGDINLAIDTLVMNQVHIFKSYINETGDKKTHTSGKNELTISYDTVFYNSDFFSFIFHVFSNPMPAAHPDTYDVSFNYCPTSVGLLKISDLFLPGSGYLKYISDYCIAALKKISNRYESPDADKMVEKGAGPDAANFETLNISKDSLIITFNPGLALPRANGLQTVKIPLSEMKSMIDPNGPLMEVK